jgi:N,N-dimethylformamidase beta subunit-like, C-terminal
VSGPFGAGPTVSGMFTHAHITRRRGRVATLAALLATASVLLFHSDSSTRPAWLDEDDELEGRDTVGRVVTNDERAIEAAFALESYRPGSIARLRLFSSGRALSVRLFRAGLEGIRTKANNMMFGVEVARVRRFRSFHAGQTLRIRIGSWTSGLYFARLAAPGDRLGFAVFVVAPRRLGENRVAIVLPTNTWQAYNVRDDDGDGIGDSWYADGYHNVVKLGRPLLDRGVPFRYRVYDLPFLRWLDRTRRRVDVLSDLDLHRASGDALVRAYRLIVFPGHHEYVTEREYDAIQRYRDFGGNLAFLSANNFYWRVVRRGSTLSRIAHWRRLGRPEAALIGVQYIGNDDGEHRGPWLVKSSSATEWLFAGTGIRAGSRFSNGGIEIDAVDASSPRGAAIVAEIQNLLGPGMTGQMSYYETERGASRLRGGRIHACRRCLPAARPARHAEPVATAHRGERVSRPSGLRPQGSDPLISR